jgi:hypothetical protein
MEIEEIEEFYKKEFESLDRQFLEGLKKGENKKLLEQHYKQRLGEIKKKYEEDSKKFFKNHNVLGEKSKKEENNEKKEKKNERFVVEPLNLKLSAKEKFSSKWDLFKFRFRIKYKNLMHKITPNFLIVFKIRTRNSLRKFSNHTRETLSRMASGFKNGFSSFAKITKSLLTKLLTLIFKGITKLFIKIFRIFKKKKKVEKKDEKSEDVKIAEKILSKDKKK